MLITFKVSNFLSFNANIEFSMRSGNVRELDTHMIKGKGRNSVDILKSAVIYGANASGKSNFIKAVDFAQDLIIGGFSEVLTENKYFRLEKNSQDKATQFEFEFKYNEKMYAYGIVISLKERKVREEWLFELLKTTDKAIFERKVLANGKSEIDYSNVKLDAKTKNRFEVYQEDLKDNQFFLAEINEKNLAEIKAVQAFHDVFDWFKNHLTIIFPESKPQGLGLMGNDDKMRTHFCHFLKLFGTGIDNIISVEKEIKNYFPNELLEEMLKNWDKDADFASLQNEGSFFSIIKDKNGNLQLLQLNTQRKINHSDTELINFDIDDESDGTQRMIELIPALLTLVHKNKTYLIDEIDRSLHPELSYKILKTFFANTQGIESQLIVSTHESSLLDLDLLRRDEIWFVEKDKNGASQMYSLEQFKPRHDKEIRKSYLQGRFGAIPFISNVENLGWLKTN